MGYACRVLTSSIGKKVQVALAGLLLCLFLVSHLAGNLLLWGGPDLYNHYAKALEANLLLPVAEVGLLLLFLLHILVALRVRYENWKARPVGYRQAAWAGGRTVASASMMWTALIVLAFLIVHVRTMRAEPHGDDLFHFVLQKLESAPTAIFYLCAMLALGLHLSHGAQAAVRTLGIEHPKLTPLVEKAGLAFAVVIAGGFGALVLWALSLGGGR